VPHELVGTRNLPVKTYQQITMLPRDTNSLGTVFGGVIMAAIDLAGAACCHDHFRNRRFSTLVVRELKFRHPVNVGDLVTLRGELVGSGTTSVTVRIEASALDRETRTEALVTEAELVFVAVDEHGAKTPLVPRED
jgi:acyl-CoA thioesterase YciA